MALAFISILLWLQLVTENKAIITEELTGLEERSFSAFDV